MYSKSIPFKDFLGKPRTKTVHFNLTETEVFKLLVELKSIFSWVESLQGAELRDIPTEEVVEFYTNFEKVLLDAWGEPSEDGMHFRKAGRYEFEESALFPAAMLEFISDPKEATKLLDSLMSENLQEIVKRADAAAVEAAKAPGATDDMAAELARLRAQLAAQGDDENKA